MKIAKFKVEDINEKLYLLELMKNFARDLDAEENNLRTIYKVTGQKQATQWDSEFKTLILLWEDEEKTIPLMKDKWEEIPKEEDEYTLDDRMKLKVIEELRKALANAC